MPIYDYRCDVCGHTFTALQAWSDEPLERCPECGARPRRLISLPAIHFKGSGWHVTDYGRKGGSSEGESKTGDRAKSEQGESKTGDRAKSEQGESKTGDRAKSEKSASRTDAAAAE